MTYTPSKVEDGRVYLQHSTTAGDPLSASGLRDGELVIQAADGRLMYKDSSGVVQSSPSSDGINKIVALTQAEYDALTPVATTLYVITD